MEHIFISGHFATNVWKYFVASYGINNDLLPLHHHVMKWWKAEYKNEAHRLFLQETPIFMCQNLWKNRYARRYGGEKSNLIRVKYRVSIDIFFLLKTAYPYIPWPAYWIDYVKVLEKCSHEIKITPIVQDKPPDQWTKQNSNGNAFANSGIGAEGIIRNKNGDFLLAYASPMGEG